jgi:tetratricopeptide (TPR) repeat protein
MPRRRSPRSRRCCSETAARHALELLEGRVDYLEERANASLVLGRALAEQERWDDALAALARAEEGFTQVSASSAVAAALVVRGDVRRRQGALDEAADLYRRAADLTNDYRF